MKLIKYPWNHVLLTVAFTAVVILSGMYLPWLGRELIWKTGIALAWMGWVIYVIAVAFLERQIRHERAITAAQDRFADIFEEGTPFSLHHPRNPQETNDIKILIAAARNERTRHLVHPKMIEWLETIQTVNPL